MKRFLFLLLACLTSSIALATSTTIWSGSKQFSSWSDVVNISGLQFSRAKADDIVRFSLQASEGAQLQVSYGSSWTNLEGLSSYGVTGDFDLILTKQLVSQLKQGIHIKGVNYTLTKVSLLSFDEGYSTECPDWFSWDDLLVSGATKGSALISMLPYSGIGWYWPAGLNLGTYKKLNITFLLPTSAPLILQVLYGTSRVSMVTLPAGTESYNLTLTSVLRNAYSVSLLSESAQTVALGSVELIDADGNVVHSRIAAPDSAPQAYEYFDLTGLQLSRHRRVITIIKSRSGDGRPQVRKVIPRTR